MDCESFLCKLISFNGQMKPTFIALCLCLPLAGADKKKPGTVLWEFETGNPVLSSSPAIGSDGTVYVGSWDNKLYAINGKSGVKLWEFETGHYVLSANGGNILGKHRR